MNTPYIKLTKCFMDPHGKRSKFIFYIKEEGFASDNHPHKLAYLNLLAISDIVLENGELVKNKYVMNEDFFDNMFGV